MSFFQPKIDSGTARAPLTLHGFDCRVAAALVRPLLSYETLASKKKDPKEKEGKENGSRWRTFVASARQAADAQHENELQMSMMVSFLTSPVANGATE